ncbi:Hypothetical protein CINCED_3A001781 [Cinara cedri]|uniref:Uncharacterized protein n=1 Tax=Cinara cedri TaxID=506608 RepID=A0A5E4NH98_9HEMI|nr:Hypothetical protein CINCED_3A001781 [Cinara cedri]
MEKQKTARSPLPVPTTKPTDPTEIVTDLIQLPAPTTKPADPTEIVTDPIQLPAPTTKPADPAENVTVLDDGSPLSDSACPNANGVKECEKLSGYREWVTVRLLLPEDTNRRENHEDIDNRDNHCFSDVFLTCTSAIVIILALHVIRAYQ